MTDAQRTRLYHPAWRRLAVVHNWFMRRGRLVGQRLEVLAGYPEAQALYQRLWDIAEQLAEGHARAVTDVDLRHACYVIVVGRDCSWKEVTNKQVNRLIDLFNVLREPDNLDYVMDWENPVNSERRSAIAFLDRQNEQGAVGRISANAYGTARYDELDLQQLTWLCKQFRNRAVPPPAARRGPREAVADAGLADVTDNPF